MCIFRLRKIGNGVGILSIARQSAQGRFAIHLIPKPDEIDPSKSYTTFAKRDLSLLNYSQFIGCIIQVECTKSLCKLPGHSHNGFFAAAGMAPYVFEFFPQNRIPPNGHPRAFHQPPSNESVSQACDPTLTSGVSGRMFRCYQPQEAAERPTPLESRQIAPF